MRRIIGALAVAAAMHVASAAGGDFSAAENGSAGSAAVPGAIGTTAPNIVLDKERGTYELRFDATFTTYVSLDIQTAITLPAGYKFTAVVPGSRDFVAASPVQGTMYVTKTVPDEVTTNATFHVLTPEGLEQKLIFKLIGKKNGPKVLAIQFERPNSSELNRTIEAMKSRYDDQLHEATSKQEEELNTSIHKNTIINAQPWFLEKEHGKLEASYKGASAYIDGMVNSRDGTYIYVVSPQKKDACDIVKLLGIKLKKSALMEAELVGEVETVSGLYRYTYRVAEIPFKKDKKGHYKSQKVEFVLQIWSEPVKIKAKAS